MRIAEIYEATNRLSYSGLYAYNICIKIEKDNIAWQYLKLMDMPNLEFGPIESSIIKEAQKIFWLEGRRCSWSDFYNNY